MNIHELKTIVDYEYPIKIVVLNNEGYGAIKDFQDDNLNKRYFATTNTNLGVEFNVTTPDYSEISRSYGLPFKSVHKNSDLENCIDWLMKKIGPAMLNINVDSSVKMQMSLKDFSN